MIPGVAPDPRTGKERAVYQQSVPPVGWAILTAYDRHGREVARLQVPEREHDAALHYLEALLNRVDPLDVRASLAVSEGGNKPARGRPRKAPRLALA